MSCYVGLLYFNECSFIKFGDFNMVLLTKSIMTALLCGLSLSVIAARPDDKRVVTTPDAPEAIGPYSQAIRAGSTLYLSGQIAIDPKTKQLMASADIETQTRLVLDNLQAVLKADGMDMGHVVSTTVFLKDLNNFAKMNAIYATYFTSKPPARATVEVARLPRDVQIEISAIAVK